MHINFRVLVVFVHDTIALLLAWVCAYWLRLDGPAFLPTLVSNAELMALALPVQAAVLWMTGLYHGVWRFASMPDVRRIALAVAICSAVVPLVMLMTHSQALVPRSVLVSMPIVALMLMCGSRLAYRMWWEHQTARSTQGKGEPVIVIGAGEAGAHLLKELTRSSLWRAVGLLDDDAAKRGRMVHGLKVSGPISHFPCLARDVGAKTAIIAMPSASHEVRRRVVELCSKGGASVLTIPSFEDLVSKRAQFDSLREVDVEDLLGRDPVQLDDVELHRFLGGRVVMVTGAGGSIGSELCRQIMRFAPARLVLFELSEFALYTLREECVMRFPQIEIACAVGDVKNARRVREVIARHRPAVILHAAAYKHVPLMEVENAWEAVRNNTFGTSVVGQAAIDLGVEKFVLVSTDKAVNPTNVMGASKRLAEMVCQALNKQGRTRFEMVRFGNVLGSNGSVIPKFQEQIARGGPITVTHPDIIRYFMSIPEAAQLVLQAGAMGQGGEIFVLEMGEPVRIIDLARDMIRLSGFSEENIRIEFTGLRPGEKLYEELLADGEETRSTHHPKVRIARARDVSRKWLDELLGWIGSDILPSDDEVRAALRRWVPEYRSPDDEAGRGRAFPGKAQILPLRRFGGAQPVE